MWNQCIGSETFNVDGKMVSRYMGEYSNGSFNGLGAMTFASGLRFVGDTLKILIPTKVIDVM